MASRIAPIEQVASRIKRPRAKHDSHLDFIRSLKCLICGDPHSTESAHVRMKDRRFAKREAGIGAKPSDIWTVPLCSECHRIQHQLGEMVFWSAYPIDPCITALALWAHTGDHEAGTYIINSARR